MATFSTGAAVLATLICCGGLRADDSPNPIPPTAIPQKVVLLSHPGEIANTSLKVVEKWKPDSGAAETDVGKVIFYKSVDLEQDYERNGAPLPPSDRKQEVSDVRTLEKSINRTWKGPQDDGRLVGIGTQVWRIPELLQAYEFHDIGTETYLGSPAIIYSYQPKPGVKAANRVQKGLLSMVGRIWVEPQTGQVLKIEFHNRATIRFGWGLLAKFTRVDGIMTMQRFGDTWVRQRVVMHLNGRELFTRMNGRLEKDYFIVSPPPAAATNRATPSNSEEAKKVGSGRHGSNRQLQSGAQQPRDRQSAVGKNAVSGKIAPQ
jgi:hypothetical protein